MWLSIVSAHAADIDELLYQEALAAVAAGDQTRAVEMLETLVERQPRHAGAWLDLALLFCDLGDGARAQEIFARIESDFDPSPVIRKLIALQRGRGCRAPEKPLTWTAGWQAGYDSNVNFGASSNQVILETSAGPTVAELAADSLPRADSFNDDWVEGFWHDGAQSLRFSLQARQYEQMKTFDTRVMALTGEQAWSADAVDGILRLQGVRAWLGDAAFLDAVTATAVVVGRDEWHGVHPAVDLAVSQNRFPAAPSFDAQVWNLRPGLTNETADYSWRANLVATGDLAQDARPGGDRYGLGAEALGTWQARPGVRLSASALVQQYRSRAPYFPPLLNEYRRQLLWMGHIDVAVDVGHGVQWLTTWTGQRNVDNLPFLDYRAGALQSGLTMKF